MNSEFRMAVAKFSKDRRIMTSQSLDFFFKNKTKHKLPSLLNLPSLEIVWCHELFFVGAFIIPGPMTDDRQSHHLSDSIIHFSSKVTRTTTSGATCSISVIPRKSGRSPESWGPAHGTLWVSQPPQLPQASGLSTEEPAFRITVTGQHVRRDSPICQPPARTAPACTAGVQRGGDTAATRHTRGTRYTHWLQATLLIFPLRGNIIS